MEEVHLMVSGKVQGVFYRSYCKDIARKENLCGWVRNTKDNEVEILAQGKRENLERLISWCRIGSPNSKVESLEFVWTTPKEVFTSFEIFS